MLGMVESWLFYGEFLGVEDDCKWIEVDISLLDGLFEELECFLEGVLRCVICVLLMFRCNVVGLCVS